MLALRGKTRGWTMSGRAWVLTLFTLLFVAVATWTQADEGRRVALVIGNGEYQYAPVLTNPPNDAKALAAKLKDLGFEVTTETDLTLAQMNDVILSFGRGSVGAEIAFIFFAGHGFQVDGQNYLLPVDGQVKDRRDLSHAALRAADLQVIFAFADPGLSILVYDACRNNPLVGTVATAAGLNSGAAATHELGGTQRETEEVIAFAAAPGATALDEFEGHSPYATALLQYVDQPTLELKDMFERVHQTVRVLTNKRQVPWMEQSLTRRFYLRSSPLDALLEANEADLNAWLASEIQDTDIEAGKAVLVAFAERLLSDPDDKEKIRTAAAGTAAETDDAIIRQGFTWLSIATSDDPQLFRQYLARFPDGPFAARAEERLATLIAEAAARPELPGKPGPTVVAVASDAAARAEERNAFDRADRRGLQRLLQATGNYRGAIDGAIGPASRSAVAAFQTTAGLGATGFVDGQTLASLIDAGASPVLRAQLDPAERRTIHRLAAVSRQGPGAEPAELLIASYLRYPDVIALWRRTADAFEAEHPGTVVEIETRALLDYRENLLAMLGARKPPDLFMTWGGGHLRALVDGRFARDLTPDMIDSDRWALTFKPGSLAELTIDDRIYAAPSRMTLISLWANRRMLEAAGVQPDDLQTWTGLMGAVRRLRAAGITPISVGAGEGWPIQLYWAALAQVLAGQAGMQAAIDGIGEGFASPAFVTAGAYLDELARSDPFQNGFPGMDENHAIGVFTDGHAAMTLNGDWIEARLLRAWKGGAAAARRDLVRIPFPPADLNPSGADMTLGGVDGWVVREGAPDQAVDLLRALNGVSVQAAIAEDGFGIPAIAAADGDIADPLLQEIARVLTLSEYHQLYLDQVFGPGAGDTLNEAVAELAAGRSTPEETAARIEAAWAPVRALWGIGADRTVPAEP